MSERAQAAARIEQFALQYPVRVRWVETDKQGIVFNGHYLTYFDIAQTEHFRSIGFREAGGMERHGLDIFVVNTNIDYRASAAFDDEIEAFVRVAELGRSSHTMQVRMERIDEAGGAHIADASLVLVGLGEYGGRPSRVPDPMREAIASFEGLADPA